MFEHRGIKFLLSVIRSDLKLWRNKIVQIPHLAPSRERLVSLRHIPHTGYPFSQQQNSPPYWPVENQDEVTRKFLNFRTPVKLL